MQEQYKNKRKELSIALSEVFNELHGKLNKSASLFANEIEISKTTVLKISKGSLDPQLSTLCKIASAFGISVSEFLKLVEKKLPDNWDILDN